MDLEAIDLDEADLILLRACDDTAGGELERVTVLEGEKVEEAVEMNRHAESIVQRGFAEHT